MLKNQNEASKYLITKDDCQIIKLNSTEVLGPRE